MLLICSRGDRPQRSATESLRDGRDSASAVPVTPHRSVGEASFEYWRPGVGQCGRLPAAACGLVLAGWHVHQTSGRLTGATRCKKCHQRARAGRVSLVSVTGVSRVCQARESGAAVRRAPGRVAPALYRTSHAMLLTAFGCFGVRPGGPQSRRVTLGEGHLEDAAATMARRQLERCFQQVAQPLDNGKPDTFTAWHGGAALAI